MARRSVAQALRSSLQNAGILAFLAVIAAWALTTVYVALDLLARLLHFQYWTDGTYHHPLHTTAIAVAFGGSAVLTGLLVAGLLAKPAGATRGHVIMLVVLASLTVLSPMPYVIHVAEAQLTNHGFARAQYRTSEEFDLRLSNRTPAPVRVCLGVRGDCARSGAAPGLPADGVLVQPGRTLLIELTPGRFQLTIVDPAPTMSTTDTTVSVDAGIQN